VAELPARIPLLAGINALPSESPLRTAPRAATEVRDMAQREDKGVDRRQALE
jgi:hypothetical protein